MEFKDFEKSGFDKGDNLFGKGSKEDTTFEPKSFVVEAKDTKPDQLKQWEATLEDDKLAKQCWDLFQKWPAATLPELVMYLELMKRNVIFEYQVAILGGTGRRGVFHQGRMAMGHSRRIAAHSLLHAGQLRR